MDESLPFITAFSEMRMGAMQGSPGRPNEMTLLEFDYILIATSFNFRFCPVH